jgi:antibiotic biosynthesis monooxygenase (ABM) superfamily enzyme
VYGTIARMKVKRENVDALRELMATTGSRQVPGYRETHVLIPDQAQDEIWLVVFFDDKASYMKNADDPAMHEEYVRYRALLDADPEWHDGEWESDRAGS